MSIAKHIKEHIMLGLPTTDFDVEDFPALRCMWRAQPESLNVYKDATNGVKTYVWNPVKGSIAFDLNGDIFYMDNVGGYPTVRQSGTTGALIAPSAELTNITPGTTGNDILMVIVANSSSTTYPAGLAFQIGDITANNVTLSCGNSNTNYFVTDALATKYAGWTALTGSVLTADTPIVVVQTYNSTTGRCYRWFLNDGTYRADNQEADLVTGSYPTDMTGSWAALPATCVLGPTSSGQYMMALFTTAALPTAAKIKQGMEWLAANPVAGLPNVWKEMAAW